MSRSLLLEQTLDVRRAAVQPSVNLQHRPARYPELRAQRRDLLADQKASKNAFDRRVDTAGSRECFFRLWINSSDQLPPHFHAKRRGEWEIRVFFLTCTDGYLDFNVKWGKGPSTGEREAILESVLNHRAALLQEWESKVCRTN